MAPCEHPSDGNGDDATGNTGVTWVDCETDFDVDGDTDTATKDVEITFDVLPEVGDPASGEATGAGLVGRLFVGPERGSDPEESENSTDTRDSDPMTLRVERA